ncbi:MAG TPA: tyrosine--tRNA ligase, partial [Firmicutes bacterium]|nr:tyrosine--tRNA ligase [Bacillota bacterium]
MTNALDVFQERGFFKQVTHEDELRQTLATRKVTAYVGFDPTADSLHVGHLMGIMALAHLQRTGHQPMALVGGGTVMIGDPSGRTELRQILSPEVINQNANKIKKQLGNYLNFGDDQAVLV